MTDKYARSILRIALAQIAKSMGFNSASVTTFDVLQDLLVHYLCQLCDKTRLYSEHCGRSEPIIDDAGLAFVSMGISERELFDYLFQVGQIDFPRKIPQEFPVERPSHLNIPRPDHPELKTRPDFIPPYLPLLKPDEPKKGSSDTFVLNASSNDLPSKARKNNIRNDPLYGDDWLTSLYDLDSIKAGLVKTIEIPEIENVGPATPPIPTAVIERCTSPQDDVSYEEREIIKNVRSSTISKPSIKIRPLSLIRPKKTLTVAQLAAAKAAVLKGKGIDSPETFRQYSAKLSPTKAARKALKAILSLSPSKEKSSLPPSPVDRSSQNSSFSIDECISSVIEQSSGTGGVSKQMAQETPSNSPGESNNPSPKSSTAEQLKRISCIESAIAQVCLSSQAATSAVNEPVNVRTSPETKTLPNDPIDAGPPVPPVPSVPPTATEPVIIINDSSSSGRTSSASKSVEDETPAEILQKILTKAKEMKKRKNLPNSVEQSGLQKRAAPPPMPIVDTSTLFHPDVTISSTNLVRKVAPLVLPKPKVNNDAATSTPSTRSITPPSTANKKLGPLRIKLNIPSPSPSTSSAVKLQTIVQESPAPPSESKKRRLSSASNAKPVPWAPLIPRKKRPKIDTTSPTLTTLGRNQTKLKKNNVMKLKKDQSTSFIKHCTVDDSEYVIKKGTKKMEKSKAEVVSKFVATKPDILKVPKLILKLGAPKFKEEIIGEDRISPTNVSQPQEADAVYSSSVKKKGVYSPSGEPSSVAPTNVGWAAATHSPKVTDYAGNLQTGATKRFSPIGQSTPPASPPPPTPSPRSLSPSGSPRHIFISPAHIDEHSGVYLDENNQSHNESHSSRSRNESRMDFQADITPSVYSEPFIVERVEWPAESQQTFDSAPLPKLKIKDERISQIPIETPKEEEPEENEEDKVWYCPICQVPYEDGVDMIACDKCDNWFHWSCVGLTKAPPDHEPWFCTGCNAKKTKSQAKKKVKK